MDENRRYRIVHSKKGTIDATFLGVKEGDEKDPEFWYVTYADQKGKTRVVLLRPTNVKSVTEI